MKPIRIIWTVMLLGVSLLNQAQKSNNAPTRFSRTESHQPCTTQKDLYEKYKEMKGVSAVYISKAMINMDPSLFARDLNLGKVSEQLNSVQVISTMDNNIKREMRKDIRSLVGSSKHELLMEQKGIVSGSQFYVSRRGDRVKELIMIVDGPASLKYVYLEGNMTLKDIQNIVSHAKTGMNIDNPSDWFMGEIAYFAGMEEIKRLEGLKELENLKELEKLGELSALKNLEGMFNSKDFESLKKFIDEDTWKCFEKSMEMINN